MKKYGKKIYMTFLTLTCTWMLLFAGCKGKEADEPKKQTEQEESKPGEGTKKEDSSFTPTVEPTAEPTPEPEKPSASGVYQKDAFFQFGLVSAKTEDKKWGFMNQKGEWVIPPIYRSVYDFGPGGFAFVSTASKQWRVIDTAGNYVSDRVYTYVSPFSTCGIAAVQEIVDKKTKRFYLYQDENGDLKEFDANMWGSLGNFSDDGYAVISIWEEETTSSIYGVIDKNFQYVLEPTKGLWIGPVNYGMFHVVDEVNEISGMMNVRGEWVYRTTNYLENYSANCYKNGLILDRYDTIRKNDGEYVTDVNEITKDLPMGAYSVENGNSYLYGDWLLVVSGSKNSSFNVNYLNKNFEPVFPYPLHFYSNDSYGGSYGDMRYGRLIVKLPVEKDADGKVTAISEISDEKSEYVLLVIDEEKNIIFVPGEKGFSYVKGYSSDGYTSVKSGNKEYSVIDRDGNILFSTTEAVEFTAK